MKSTQPADSFSKQSKAALQSLINQLIIIFLPVAARNNSFIVNDVSPELNSKFDEKAVTSVINGLLHSVIYNAKESCIRISAIEMYGKTILVSVKDSNSFNTYGVACSLQDVVPLAQKIGGQLDITNQRQKVTTVAFRFPIAG